MQIAFDQKAIDFLESLPHEIRERIFRKILSTKENPHHFFIRLKDRSEYRLRVGDYRVIAEINSGQIIVLLIGHRKDAYQ
jgi:mRNA interferase RelE/StbE